MQYKTFNLHTTLKPLPYRMAAVLTGGLSGGICIACTR